MQVLICFRPKFKPSSRMILYCWYICYEHSTMVKIITGDGSEFEFSILRSLMCHFKIFSFCNSFLCTLKFLKLWSYIFISLTSIPSAHPSTLRNLEPNSGGWRSYVCNLQIIKGWYFCLVGQLSTWHESSRLYDGTLRILQSHLRKKFEAA